MNVQWAELQMCGCLCWQIKHTFAGFLHVVDHFYTETDNFTWICRIIQVAVQTHVVYGDTLANTLSNLRSLASFGFPAVRPLMHSKILQQNWISPSTLTRECMVEPRCLTETEKLSLSLRCVPLLVWICLATAFISVAKRKNACQTPIPCEAIYINFWLNKLSSSSFDVFLSLAELVSAVGQAELQQAGCGQVVEGLGGQRESSVLRVLQWGQ